MYTIKNSAIYLHVTGIYLAVTQNVFKPWGKHVQKTLSLKVFTGLSDLSVKPSEMPHKKV